MPTKAEIQAQIDALTAQLGAAGDDGADTELWVRDEKGRETRLTGENAKKWLRSLGLEDDAPPDPAQGDGPPDPPPAGGDTVWGRKK
jgi:hypothetical protein